MEQHQNDLNRRDMLTRVAGLIPLALVGGCTLGVKGCVDHYRDKTREEYAARSAALEKIVSLYYPDSAPSKPLGHQSEDLSDALGQADSALRCYGELLSIEHPFLRQHPLINSVHEAKASSDSMLGESGLREYKEYQDAEASCLSIRTSLCNITKEAEQFLSLVQQDPDQMSDSTVSGYVNSLVPRLEILSNRMQAGKLMVSENILQWSSKFGEFAEMIGQTEHYEEALAEIKALKGYLDRR
jgi:hypothetical protein